MSSPSGGIYHPSQPRSTNRSQLRLPSTTSQVRDIGQPTAGERRHCAFISPVPKRFFWAKVETDIYSSRHQGNGAVVEERYIRVATHEKETERPNH